MRPSQDHGAIADPQADQQRITALGAFLRDHGWDEMPQIINILIGQMNFIGPRPLHANNYAQLKNNPAIPPQLLAEWQQRRDTMPGGLNGWQQINQLSFMYDAPAAMRYDLEYLAAPSFKK